MRERFTGLWRDREFLKYWPTSAISDVGSQITAPVVSPVRDLRAVPALS